MISVARKSAATILIAAIIVPLATAASAAPIADALAIKNAAPATVEAVRWRGGWGWGIGAGLAAGAIIGGALAAPYYYGGYYGGPYYGGAYYADPGYYAEPYAGG